MWKLSANTTFRTWSLIGEYCCLCWSPKCDSRLLTVRIETPKSSEICTVVNPCSTKNCSCSSGMIYEGRPRPPTINSLNKCKIGRHHTSCLTSRANSYLKVATAVLQYWRTQSLSSEKCIISLDWQHSKTILVHILPVCQWTKSLVTVRHLRLLKPTMIRVESHKITP